MTPTPLISFTDRGIYCPPGNFFIDPWKPTGYAVITHAHADHARPNQGFYLAHEQSVPVMRIRLGSDIKVQGVKYGEVVIRNGVKISLHPAGHILGSAQVRLEHQGQVCVISGDYKTEVDAVCQAFEPVKCHSFVTESTFGLPIYDWKPEAEIFQEINTWWRENQATGKTTLLMGYALGKAQRLLSGLDPTIGNVYAHGAIWKIHEVLKPYLNLPIELNPIDNKAPKSTYEGSLVIAPPSVMGTGLGKFRPLETGMGSGWMAIRGMKRRRTVDKGFVISDHADWKGLNAAVKATEAEKVYVTHGYSDVFSRHLQEQGIDAQVVETLYEGEVEETPPAEQNG